MLPITGKKDLFFFLGRISVGLCGKHLSKIFPLSLCSRPFIICSNILLSIIFINSNSGFSFATVKALCSDCMRFLRMAHDFGLLCSHLQMELVDLNIYSTIFRVLYIRD